LDGEVRFGHAQVGVGAVGSNLGFGQVVLPSAKIDGSRSRARRGGCECGTPSRDHLGTIMWSCLALQSRKQLHENSPFVIHWGFLVTYTSPLVDL